MVYNKHFEVNYRCTLFQNHKNKPKSLYLNSESTTTQIVYALMVLWRKNEAAFGVRHRLIATSTESIGSALVILNFIA